MTPSPISSLPTRRRFLLHYLTPFWGHALLACLLSLLLGFLATLIVAMIGPAIQLLANFDQGQTTSITELLGSRLGGGLLVAWPQLGEISFVRIIFWLPIGILIIAGFKALFQFSNWYLWEWLAEGIAKDMRQEIVKAYLRLDPSQRKKFPEDELSSSVTTDCKLFREYLVHFYGGLPREAVQVVFMLITQFLLSPKLCGLFFIGVMPLAVVMTRLGKKIKKRASLALSNYSMLTEWLQQRLLGIETVKHYGTEASEINAMRAKAMELNGRLWNAARMKARTSPMGQFIAIACMVVVLMIALQDIASGELAGPVALSFFSSLAMMGQSVSICGRYYNSNREGAAAVDRIIQTQRTLASLHKADTQPGMIHKPGEMEKGILLKLDNVSASYPPSEIAAISGINLSLEAHRIYCLMGPSGSGKSTLAKVFCGLLPHKGEITHGGKKSRLNIGYMPQDVLLFPGSIAEQVSYPNKDCDLNLAKSALISAGLWETLVNELPQGLGTPVGIGGRQLSGGQAQRLLLARLFYHRFDLIIIDEGTSALDPISEGQFYAAIKELLAFATIILIAHRPSALKIADHVLEMSAGKLSI